MRGISPLLPAMSFPNVTLLDDLARSDLEAYVKTKVMGRDIMPSLVGREVMPEAQRLRAMNMMWMFLTKLRGVWADMRIDGNFEEMYEYLGGMPENGGISAGELWSFAEAYSGQSRSGQVKDAEWLFNLALQQ